MSLQKDKSLKKMKVVEEGYDKIADAYYQKRDLFDNINELREFYKLLPPSARVLDVGCGGGLPVCKFLSNNNCNVIGIDISEKMIELARKNVPQALFRKMNMTEIDFEHNSFGGLTAFYSIIHVPKALHAKLFADFHKILKPGGLMLLCLGPDDWESVEDYYGVDMFWSHYGPEESLSMILKSES